MKMILQAEGKASAKGALSFSASRLQGRGFRLRSFCVLRHAGDFYRAARRFCCHFSAMYDTLVNNKIRKYKNLGLKKIQDMERSVKNEFESGEKRQDSKSFRFTQAAVFVSVNGRRAASDLRRHLLPGVQQRD
ncbi:hypothetical protein [Caproiciproducens faecalis]|uniref:Uncharacterized protein n=1 Tax=Caproiciproducens faecalis TaxID=2820301 RepID=A0ABS7DMY7_9FIRM|nr:hypothetical protein [Caproiciproducens faecalis]MBW7572665.1 hypothetical protein [Caproiciproducens faecalis]